LQYHEFNSIKSCATLDLGCGTGVLGLIVNHLMRDKDHSLYVIDDNENAIKSAKINSQVLEVKKFRSLQTDATNIEVCKLQMIESKYYHYSPSLDFRVSLT
jgi:16S rRNA G1207 methylase RsmC